MTVVHLATHSQDTPPSGESIKRLLPSNPAAADVITATGSGASGKQVLLWIMMIMMMMIMMVMVIIMTRIIPCMVFGYEAYYLNHLIAFMLIDELSMGMAAGIQLIGWEVAHCFDYPDELLKNHTLKKLTAPNDLIKVK